MAGYVTTTAKPGPRPQIGPAILPNRVSSNLS